MTGFFAEDDPQPNILRADRVFLGAAQSYNGKRDQSVEDTRGWVGQDAAGYFTYNLNRASECNISPIGGVAYSAATRTSDGPVGMVNVAISYSALAVSDIVSADASVRRGAWGFYGVACRAADDGMGGIAGSAMNELHAANLGGVVDCNPYLSRDSKSGVTYGLILGAGGEYAQCGLPTNQISAALHISGGKGNAKFRKGIHFTCNSLDGTNGYTGGAADAIVFSRFHQQVWVWSGSDAARGFTIRSDCNSLAGATKLVSTNSGLQVFDQHENAVARFTPSALSKGEPCNFLTFKNSKVGGDPVIIADGSESYSNVVVQGKGGGGFIAMNSAGDIQFCVNAATKKTLSAELPANATGAQIATAINLIRSLLVDVRLAS